MKCPNCQSRDIDFQEAGGQSICMSCGTVVEENTIVSSIEFQEMGDRSHVIGQFVAANCAKPYMSSSRMLGRHVDNKDSKEVSLLNARRTISQIASSMRLPAIYIDRAHRLYQIAITREIHGGRKQSHIVAACLYVICRQEKSPHLLIDFADALQINVYSLGKAYLKLYRVLNLPMDVIDPSLYIHRYADKLEFGDRMSSVVTTSLRIITRLKKDWIVTGRRPDGVCAASLLIAARAHEFDITQETIASLFHISMDTVRKRVMEFRATPAAQLNLQQFYALDDELQLEFDPPAFIRNKLRENEAVELCLGDAEIFSSMAESGKEAEEEEGDTKAAAFKAGDLAKDGVYVASSDSEDENEIGNDKAERLRPAKAMRIGDMAVVIPLPFLQAGDLRGGQHGARHGDEAALYEEMYSDMLLRTPAQMEMDEDYYAEDDDDNEFNIDNGHDAEKENGGVRRKRRRRSQSRLKERKLIIQMDLVHHRASHFVSNNGIQQLLPSLLVEDRNLEDDEEVANCLFSEEEQRKRAALFEKAYGPFLEERERRRRAREGEAGADSDRYTQTGKLRKKYQRKLLAQQKQAAGQQGQLDSKTFSAATQAVAASKSSIKSASKKINYDALQGVFDETGSFALPQGQRQLQAERQLLQQQRELAQVMEWSALSGAAALVKQQMTLDHGGGSASVNDSRSVKSKGKGRERKMATLGHQPRVISAPSSAVQVKEAAKVAESTNGQRGQADEAQNKMIAVEIGYGEEVEEDFDFDGHENAGYDQYGNDEYD